MKSYDGSLLLEFRLTYFCTDGVIVPSLFKHSCITLISLDIDDLWSVICFPTLKLRFIFYVDEFQSKIRPFETNARE